MNLDRDKLLSISVMKKSKDASRDYQLSKDRDAYKRLRKEGLQPPRVDGSARLEKEAVTPLEIQTGVVQANLPQKDRQRMADRLSNFDFEPAKFLR